MSKDFIPHDYQQSMIDFVQRTRRGGLWAGMGSGKSVTVLTALDQLNFVEDVFPALVLGPKRVVRSVWAQEAAKWNHTKHLRVSVITGTPMQRRRAIAAEADIYCTNYENLTWLMGELGGEWPYHVVVADEVTRLKSFRIRQGGKRAHSLSKVAHAEVKRFIGLTGTPAPNGLKDQWGQTWFYDKGERLGATFTAFENRWFQKGHNGFGLEPRAHAQEEIHAKLKDICLTVKGLQVDEPIFNDILVDVPPSVRQLYKALEESMFAELENDRTVSAVHAAARTGKCIAEGTEVLTQRGWVPVETVSARDKTWDGVEWTSNQGVVCNGDKAVVACWGVQMTPDHKVLTTSGWRQAQEILCDEPRYRPYRADLWIPNCTTPGRKPKNQRNQRKGTLAGTLRLWEGVGARQPEPQEQTPGPEKILRLPSWRDATGGVGLAWHVWAPCVGNVVQHEIALQKSQGQRLAELWRSRHNSVRALGAILQQFLGGHGPLLAGGTHHRTHGQRRRLHPRKLPVALAPEAGEQSAGERADTNSHRPHNREAGRPQIRPESHNHTRQTEAGLAGEYAAYTPVTRRVFDILNAGPRHRFTVRGGGGQVFIVHNCLQICNGAVYTDKDHWETKWEPIHGAKLDALESIVEEANGMPVLVGYQFISDRVRILERFPQARFLDDDPQTIVDWNAGRIPMLVCHPKSAGHGLSLQDGSNILAFFGLGWNMEEYLQLIERLGPMRQKQSGYDRPVFVHRILLKDSVDEMQLKRMETKRSVQDILLEAMEKTR